MMVMTTRKPEISVQARCSVAVIMCSFGFSLSRCHSLTVAKSTRKAIRYPSTASALAVSWKLAYLENMSLVSQSIEMGFEYTKET